MINDVTYAIEIDTANIRQTLLYKKKPSNPSINKETVLSHYTFCICTLEILKKYVLCYRLNIYTARLI